MKYAHTFCFQKSFVMYDRVNDHSEYSVPYGIMDDLCSVSSSITDDLCPVYEVKTAVN